MLDLNVILILCTYGGCFFSQVSQAWRPSHLWPASLLWAHGSSNSCPIIFSFLPSATGLQQPSHLMPTTSSPLGSQNPCLLPNSKPCLSISPIFTLHNHLLALHLRAPLVHSPMSKSLSLTVTFSPFIPSLPPTIPWKTNSLFLCDCEHILSQVYLTKI